jgi:ADP-ribosyltransferase exoenzyme
MHTNKEKENDNDHINHKKILEKLKETALENDQKTLYVYGPLPLKQVTRDFEKVVKALLNDKQVIFSENKGNELIAFIDSSSDSCSINITQTLLGKPDLEHIQFSRKELDKFVEYAYHENKDLTDNETFNRSKILHQGEIIAIKYYTSQAYQHINGFFRTYAVDFWKESEFHYRSQKFKEVLLIASIATSAIFKLPANPEHTEAFRVDGHTTAKTRIDAFLNKHILYENSFYSTSNFRCVTHFEKEGRLKFSFHLIIGNYHGKLIELYSAQSKEKEILFGVGAMFAPLAFHQKNDVYYFVYKPTRALKIIGQNPKPVSYGVDSIQSLETSLPCTLASDSSVMSHSSTADSSSASASFNSENTSTFPPVKKKYGQNPQAFFVSRAATAPPPQNNYVLKNHS